MIFCTIGLENHANALIEFLNNEIGSDLVVTVNPHYKLTKHGVQNDQKSSLPYEKLTQFLAREKSRGDKSEIKASAFVTHGLTHSSTVSSTKFANFAWFPFSRYCDVIGIESSFEEASYNKFILSTSLDSTAKDEGAVKSLYTDDLTALHSSSEFMHAEGWAVPSIISGENASGYVQRQIYDHPIPALVPAAFDQIMSLKTDLPFLLSLSHHEWHKEDHRWHTETLNYFVWGRGHMYGFPGISGMASYTITALIFYTPMIVSLPTYYTLMHGGNNAFAPIEGAENGGGPTNASMNVPYAKLFLKLKNPHDLKARTKVKDTVRAYVDSNGENVLVKDAVQSADAISDVTATVLLLANLMGVTCLLLFFFLCVVTFTANIQDNAWELGVLRAIGLTSAQVSRVYIYEAVVLVTASVIGGLVVGLVTAATITYQFTIFVEMPFEYNVPVMYIILIITIAMFTAVLASYYPAQKLLRKQIASIIKGAS
eukprot:TRINITY_DN24366_c0_g1_i2.p1 TRINITY_DN24366_c0_g1~~TRINITY_DN24366_c0_g1_i2.p1  ORF type:complete len:484 (-),score=92.92 TRINITY_DN24366_c0_g1_i2:281-1732(-)